MSDRSNLVASPSEWHTRNLCAALYTDRKLRRRVYELLFHRRPQALLPAPFVDTAAVAAHCLHALGRERRWAAVIAALAVALPLTSTNWRGSEPSSLDGLFSPIALLASGVYLLLVGALVWKRHGDRYGQHIQRLRAGHMDLPDPTYGSAQEKQEVERIGELQRSANVVVYSGPQPFVDGGLSLRSWSFALELQPKAQGTPDLTEARRLDSAQPHASSATRLYCRAEFHERVAEAIMALDLPGTEVEDLNFVPGRKVGEVSGLLSDDGGLSGPKLSVADLEEDPFGFTGVVRRFLCVRVPLWGGQYVVTEHFRVSSVGRSIYVECHCSVLPPLSEVHTWLARAPQHPSLEETIRNAGRSIFFASVDGLWIPLQTLAEEALWWSRRESHFETRRRIAGSRDYDFGSRVSLRMLGTSIALNDMFELSDIEATVKLLENRLLDAVRKCLEECGFETTEFTGRGATVLNNGVMNNVLQIGNDNVGVSMAAPAGGGPQSVKPGKVKGG